MKFLQKSLAIIIFLSTFAAQTIINNFNFKLLLPIDVEIYLI